MTTQTQLKQKFWNALADSPFVFLQLDRAPHETVPMTAQLDKDADGTIWFFTTRDHTLAQMGAATATFADKGHDLFARFTGNLTEETSTARRDKQWSRITEAFFPEGKDDPNMIMLRMDLGQAQIWNSDLGLIDTIKMLTGQDVREDTRDETAEMAL